jgi:uncharacterized protein (TIGR03086 family)
VALLERALAYTLGSLAQVTEDDLPRPTPCTGWDLAQLLQHMDESLVALTEAADGYLDLSIPVPKPVLGHPTAGISLITPAARLRERACSLLAAWLAPQSSTDVTVGDVRMRADILAGAGALEVAVHGWDVAASIGHNHRLPRALAQDLAYLATTIVDHSDRPQRFAAEVPVVADATPAEQLLGFLGRDPSSPLR